MASAVQIEQLLAEIVQMDRVEVVRALRALPCGFELDFSQQYLDSLPVERLRHILLAARLHAGNVSTGHPTVQSSGD